ncbi:MAG: hypothetical protein JSW17_00450 [Candidatus Omnitrophota bacterium]|nr:MAG: hypothetical protein JSW17_00450 [Candidatus Omnitrophota bacterium]
MHNLIHAKRKSFSLIELVTVIVALGVFSVAVVVSTDSAKVNKLIGAANKLMFDIRYAQQLALSRHTDCGVSFDPASDTYFVYIGDTSTKAIDPHLRTEFMVDYTSESEYSGIDLVSTNFGDLISFDNIGTPYDSSAVELSSQGSVIIQTNSYTKNVTVQPSTGKVKVQ